MYQQLLASSNNAQHIIMSVIQHYLSYIFYAPNFINPALNHTRSQLYIISTYLLTSIEFPNTFSIILVTLSIMILILLTTMKT